MSPPEDTVVPAIVSSSRRTFRLRRFVHPSVNEILAAHRVQREYRFLTPLRAGEWARAGDACSGSVPAAHARYRISHSVPGGTDRPALPRAIDRAARVPRRSTWDRS